MKPLRASRFPLRLVCVARLVEKKGLDHQLRIYAALRAAGLSFAARIVGDGPLRPDLEKLAGRLGVAADVTFTGQLPQHEVWTQLLASDILLHTGVIAASGDRDGLPNVIPEAMAIGVLVVTSPSAATTEAVEDGVTGLVAPVESPQAWVAALRRLSADDALAESLRAAARTWVEENFDAHRNAARLLEQFRLAIQMAGNFKRSENFHRGGAEYRRDRKKHGNTARESLRVLRALRGESPMIFYQLRAFPPGQRSRLTCVSTWARRIGGGGVSVAWPGIAVAGIGFSRPNFSRRPSGPGSGSL